MHPVTIITLIVFSILFFTRSRKDISILILLGACFFTGGQVIVIANIDFYASRIFIIIAFIRILIKKDYKYITFNRIDTLMIILTIFMVITGTLLESGNGFINRVGKAIDYSIGYFIFRISITGVEDIKRIFRILIVVFIPIAIVMVIEQLTGKNPFFIFGGVSEFSIIRDGRIRSSASFPHPILAGTIGAIHLPIYISFLWDEKYDKRMTITGIVVAAVITLTSASSGPIMTAMFGMFGMILYRFRRSFKQFILISCSVLILMSILMRAPIWFLLARIDLTGSSTGWHRAQLISSALYHLKEWWLIGTNYTRHWMPTGVSWSPIHTDITNYYIQWGVNGGLPSLIPFVLIIFTAFKFIKIYFNSPIFRQKENSIFIWALGSVLFAHILTFFSIPYWSQVELIWNLHIAMISSMYMYIRDKQVGLIRADIDSQFSATEKI